jgi:hypothetical protein
MICLKKLSPLGAGLAGLGLWAIAVNAGNTDNNLPAIINFYGPAPQTLANGFPGLHADQPLSDDPATTTDNYVNGTQNVAAYFYGKAGGNAGLDTTATSRQPVQRYLYLDLSAEVSRVPNTPYPFLSGTTAGRIAAAHISQNLLHADASGNLVCCGGTTGFGLTTITPSNMLSNPQYGEMAVFWPDPVNQNRQWKIVWGGDQSMSSCLHTSVNSTGDLWTVNTFGYPSGQIPTNLPQSCSQGPNSSDHDVAAVLYAPTKGNVTWTLEGYYHAPFSFTIQKQ